MYKKWLVWKNIVESKKEERYAKDCQPERGMEIFQGK